MKRSAEEIELENGLTIEEVAGTAGKVYLASQNLPQPTDPAESAADDPSWQRVARRAAAQFGGDFDDLRVSDLAALMYHAHSPSELGGEEEFSSLPMLTQFAWHAVARHLANVIIMDEEELSNFAKHEAHWDGWAAARASGGN